MTTEGIETILTQLESRLTAEDKCSIVDLWLSDHKNEPRTILLAFHCGLKAGDRKISALVKALGKLADACPTTPPESHSEEFTTAYLEACALLKNYRQ